jgi:drug/metabolite transporter (DMT)-like permease
LTQVALGLVLVAAFAHSGWNYLTKKAGGGLPFIWIFAGVASTLYFPVALGVIIKQKPAIGVANVAMMLASAAVHLAYFTLLEWGYRMGDMSVVYPIARGTGPLISATIGVLFLGERPSPIGAAGIVLMAVGIATVTGDPRKFTSPEAKKAVLAALLCGATVATYTVLDKISVSTLKTPPLLLDWATNFGRFLMLTPFALRVWPKVKEEWKNHKWYALGVGFLSPFAYILVLTAMVFTPVSYVAPAREISILIGAAIGARAFAEGSMQRKMVGTAAMVIGLVALSLG